MKMDFPRLHSLSIPQGGIRGFLGGISKFLEREEESPNLLVPALYLHHHHRHHHIVGSINNIIVPMIIIIIIIIINNINNIFNTLLLKNMNSTIYMFKSIPTKGSQFPQLPKCFEMEFGPQERRVLVREMSLHSSPKQSLLREDRESGRNRA